MKNRHDPLDLRGQERSKKDAESRDRLAREGEEDDIKWLMKCRQGRRIVWRMLDQAGVFRLSFNTNAMAMAFAEGNRNAGLRLLAIVHKIAPELYQTMVKENSNEHRSNDDGNRNDH